MARNLSDAENIQATKVAQWAYHDIFNYGLKMDPRELINREIIIEALMIDDEIAVYTDDQRSKILALL